MLMLQFQKEKKKKYYDGAVHDHLTLTVTMKETEIKLTCGLEKCAKIKY